MVRTSVLLRFALLSLFLAGEAGASRLNPVSWTLQADAAAVTSGSTVLLQLQAHIDNGYHLYSFTTPAGGPGRTTAVLESNPAFTGLQVYQPQPNRHVDPTLGVPVETFESSASFPVLLTLSDSVMPGTVSPEVQVRYQACSDEICLPPVTRMVHASLAVAHGAPTVAQVSHRYKLAASSGVVGSKSIPMAMPLHFGFLLGAFGFGVLALFTPCVFPTIPLTVSFLLQNGNAPRRKVLGKAGLFCLGIVLLFSTLGLGATALAGPFSVIQLASSPWVNGFVAIVFFAMGLSLVGAFHFTVPSALLTRVDGAAQKGGLVPGLLLGLTFCLASFTCVGPFLGALLAASAQRGGWAPALGTIAFASGLALPFFLLSLFPASLRGLPRSGVWLQQLKTAFGFVVIAAAFKYLGSADSVAHWDVFTRERILAIWFALLLVLAFYLLGQIRLATEADSELGIGRVLAGAAVLAAAITVASGLWGVSLGSLEAFLPASEMTMTSARIPGAVASEANLAWLKDDYDGALAKAKEEHKPLLIAFSGYACTNCHWMKANVFSKPEVMAALKSYVLVELYTDGTDAASARNQKLEQDQFATVALPYYVIADADGHPLAHREGLTRRASEFVAFLEPFVGQTVAQRL